jgi:hypothetical protein
MLYNPVHSFNRSIHVSVKVAEESSAVKKKVLIPGYHVMSDPFKEGSTGFNSKVGTGMQVMLEVPIEEFFGKLILGLCLAATAWFHPSIDPFLDDGTVFLAHFLIFKRVGPWRHSLSTLRNVHYVVSAPSTEGIWKGSFDGIVNLGVFIPVSIGNDVTNTFESFFSNH